MKFTISWYNYPNCPEATLYSKKRAYLGFFLRYFSLCVFILLLVGIINFTREYWIDNNWLQYFAALFCLLLGGVLAHLVFVLYPRLTERGVERILLRFSYGKILLKEDHEQEKKDVDKFYKEEIRDDAISYYFYFIFVALILAVGCILVNSFVQIGSHGQGIGWLAFSICALIGLIIGFKYIKDKYIWL